MILECKPIANQMLNKLIDYRKFNEKSKNLIIVYQGTNKGQQSYIKNIIKYCELLKFDYELIDFDEIDYFTAFRIGNIFNYFICVEPFNDCTRKDIQYLIKDSLHDIDNFTSHSPYNSCTAEGVLKILQYNNISIQDKLIAVIGRNEGNKISNLLSNKDNNATVVNLHSKTPKAMFNQMINVADIIISATGTKNLLNKSNINKTNNKVIIDIGRGDISKELYNYNNLKITPKINGTDLITTIVLMEHIIKEK